MAVRFAGVLVVVRIIGPANYGIYAGAAAFVALVTAVTQMGTEVFLIRQIEEPDARAYDEALGFLVITSLIGVALALGASFAVAPIVHDRTALKLFRVLLVSVPLNICWAPAQARIERSFAYGRIGALEVGSDLVLYAIAVPLALSHFQAWSLVLGWIGCEGYLLIGSYLLAGLGFRPRWPRGAARELLRHGSVYGTTSWLGQLAALANPIVVGSFIGAAGVGYVALAIRLVATLGFASRAAWRVGLASLSKLRDHARLSAALRESMALYVVALGLPLAGFAILARVLVPLLFGSAWTPVISLFALMACARTLSSPAALQSTLLFSRGRNLAVAITVAITTSVLFLVAWLAVPRLGVDGYGVAVLCTAVTVPITDRLARQVVDFSYLDALPFAVAILPLFFVPLLPWPEAALLFSPAVTVTLVAPSRRSMTGTLRTTLASLRPALRSDSSP
jgi:O-antigen/teichoic acid export membrane protein